MSITPAREIISSQCPWMSHALSELGVTEQQGSGANPNIIKYYREAGMTSRTDETHWCAAFIWWCLRQVYPNLALPPHCSAARSFLHYGSSQGRNSTRYGGIVVFEGLVQRSESTSGFHCSFYCGVDPSNHNKIICLGGNQSMDGNQGCVCYKSYPKNKVRDIRWPL